MTGILEIITSTFTRDLPLELNVFTGVMPLFVPLVIMLFLSLVQSFVLKIQFPSHPYRKHLASALFMKLASTIAASLIQYATHILTSRHIDSNTFFLTLGLFSAMCEYPLLLLLYKAQVNWKRGIAKILILNATVFSILYISEKTFWAVGFIHYEYRQKQSRLDWNHQEILKGEPGYIYMTVSRPTNLLERFSLESGTTEQLTGTSFFSVGSAWNVAAGKLVCMVDRTGKNTWDFFYSILSLPDFSLIQTIKMRETPRDSGEYHGTTSPYMDRSGNYVAMIEPLGKIVAQKNATAHFEFGDKAKIHLCNARTGEDFYQYPELVIGDEGFDWSPDSRKIVFVSFRDKSLFIPSDKTMKGNITIGYDKHPKYLYVYNLDTSTLTELCEGARPNWSPDGKSILFVKNRAAYIYSFEKQNSSKLFDQDSYAYKWSPTGKNIICWSNSHLVVINVADPNKKMIIKNDYFGPEFFWSEK